MPSAGQARIFRTLVEAVEHDGRTGSLAIRLGRDGIVRFAEELAPPKAEVA